MITGRTRRAATVGFLAALMGCALLAAPTAGQAASQQTGNIPLNGTPQTVSLTTPGEIATFHFPGTTGEAFSSLLSSSTFTGCPAVTVAVIRPDASQLTSVNTCNGSAFLDQVALDQDGTWSLQVTPANNGTGSATLQAYNPTDQTKTVTVSGSAVNAAIKWPGQNGDYTFSGSAGQEISAQTSSSTIGCVAYTLVRPNGTTLQAGQQGCNASDFFDAQTLDATGTWAVHLDPQGPATGTATLNVYDATDQTKTIKLNGPVVKVSTTHPGQNVSLTFSGTSGQGVSAQVTGATFGGCPAFTAYLRRPNGTQLGSAASSCNASLLLPGQTLDATGTWTIVIDPAGTTTGKAQVQAFETGDVVVPITLNGAPASVNLGPNGQQGSYTFTGSVGQQVSAQVSDSTFPGCTAYVLSLQRPNHTQLGPSVNGCGATAFFDSATLDADGTWAFVFAPSGTSGGTTRLQAYTFADQSQPTFDMAGKNNKLVIGKPGQNAITTFSGTSGQHVSAFAFRSTLVGCTAFTVSLVRPNGTTLTTQSTCTDSAFVDQTALDATGTWKVLVDPQGPLTGTVLLQLYAINDVHPAIKPGGPIKSFTTTTRGLNAHFTFTGKAGDVRTVTITGSTFTGCPGLVVSFIRPNGTVLSTNSTCNRTLTLGPSTLNVAGTWQILVDPQGPVNGTLIIKVT